MADRFDSNAVRKHFNSEARSLLFRLKHGRRPNHPRRPVTRRLVANHLRPTIQKATWRVLNSVVRNVSDLPRSMSFLNPGGVKVDSQGRKPLGNNDKEMY
jgi:hypothetical protein